MEKPEMEREPNHSKNINRIYLANTSEHYRTKNRLTRDISAYAMLKAMKQAVR